MIILHIITGLNNGGAEATLFRLVTADGNNTHHVISLMDDVLYGERLISVGISGHSLQMPRGQVTVKGLFKLYKLIQMINPNVVQTWMYHADLIGGIIARITGRRTVVWGIRNSNLDRDKTRWSTRWVAKLCARLSGWVPSRIVSCSEQAARVHIGLGYDKRRIVVIQNGYDLTQLSPDHASGVRLRGEWGIDPDTVLLGMCARWDPQKDHPNLIAALAKLKAMGFGAWSCVLVGHEITEENVKLTALLVEYGVHDRVQLLGPRADIPAVMNALDLHVLSSAGEAFPNVVAEAMACCTPCVVTDVGDAALIVGNTGWIVPPGVPVQLATAMYDAMNELADVEKWRLRQKAARERVVANFPLERMVEGYRAVWNAVASEEDVISLFS